MRRLPAAAPIVTAEGMRAAEQAAMRAGTTAIDLMERAALAVAREVRRLAARRPVLVLAGPGNNGGDGYGVARMLADWRLDVAVATVGSPRGGAAGKMAARWTGPTTTIAAAAPRPILVDALFGTGADRPLDGGLAADARRLADGAELVIAVDLPSGLPADTPPTGAHIHADVTVAIGALKPAHLIGAAAECCGHVLLADIGVPLATAWRTLRAPELRRPGATTHKFSRGLVVVVGGTMPGAGWLASASALHGGAGYVILAAERPAAGEPHAIVRRPLASPAEIVDLLADERIGAVVIGPGLGRDPAAGTLLAAAIACDHPLVVDGDALTLLGRDLPAQLAARSAPTVLTPHEGEFKRCFGSAGGKITATARAAAVSGATVVHKGADTVVAAPDGQVVVAAGASSWLSTAGSGDVLAGLVGARLASGDAAAAEAAVWLHSRAADLAGAAFAADDLVRHLPAALAP